VRVAFRAAVLEGVNHLFNLILFYAFYFHRRRWGLSLSRNRVISGRAEQIDVEYWVYLHSGRQFQFTGVRPNHSLDSEGSKVLLI
jgi:hypothetical protein